VNADQTARMAMNTVIFVLITNVRTVAPMITVLELAVLMSSHLTMLTDQLVYVTSQITDVVEILIYHVLYVMKHVQPVTQ
jgi:hypothetical protein